MILLQQKADLLLMLTHRGQKGIPSSKLYEYLAIQKPILCFPSDHDIVEETLLQTKAGIVIDLDNVLYQKLSEFITIKLNGQQIYTEVQKENLLEYSVSNQVKKISILLKKIS